MTLSSEANIMQAFSSIEGNKAFKLCYLQYLIPMPIRDRAKTVAEHLTIRKRLCKKEVAIATLPLLQRLYITT